MLATCPTCGCDLEALRSYELGRLTIEDGVNVLWNGQKVKLTPCERLIVLALSRAGGAVVKRAALAEAAGYEGEDPNGVIGVWLNRINKAFRNIDPDFAAIETVWRSGLRWRTA